MQQLGGMEDLLVYKSMLLLENFKEKINDLVFTNSI